MKNNVEEWKDKKFGMFIHWGLYSLLGKGEWAMFNEPIDKDEYSLLSKSFTAENFNADEWAKLALDAGMGYMVLTSRHHDGFSLWDSKSSYESFTSVNSAAKKDIVREYCSAARKAGLKVGLYYSPMDWRFPGFFLPRMYANSASLMRQQCHNQVRELLSDYGKIDILWYDGGEDFWLCHGKNLHNSNDTQNFRDNPQCPGFWGAEELDKTARKLQPDIVINNRTGNWDFGDFITPEGKVGEFNTETPWESCMTLDGSWGWQPDLPILSLRSCINTLVRVVTGGGNLLLNVGPKADGTIEESHAARLREIGGWLKEYGESIYNTRGGPFINGEWGGTTYNDRKLYIHILDWRGNTVRIAGLNANILNAVSKTASELSVTVNDKNAGISVSARDRLDIDTIIELTFDRPVKEACENAKLLMSHI